MAWTCYVTQRAQGDDIGTVESVWNEGQADEVRIPHPTPLRIDVASKAIVKTYAEAELARLQAVETRNAQLSATLTTFMNA